MHTSSLVSAYKQQVKTGLVEVRTVCRSQLTVSEECPLQSVSGHDMIASSPRMSAELCTGHDCKLTRDVFDCYGAYKCCRAHRWVQIHLRIQVRGCCGAVSCCCYCACCCCDCGRGAPSCCYGAAAVAKLMCCGRCCCCGSIVRMKLRVWFVVVSLLLGRGQHDGGCARSSCAGNAAMMFCTLPLPPIASCSTSTCSLSKGPHVARLLYLFLLMLLLMLCCYCCWGWRLSDDHPRRCEDNVGSQSM